MVIKNKKGWIKVLEVFAAILMVMGVVVLLVGQNYFSKNISDDVISMEVSILNKIRHNESFRNAILEVSLPTNWTEFNSTGLDNIYDEILNNKFSGFYCEAKVCSLDDFCKLDFVLEKDVYAESAIISASETKYSPRQFKIFCWEK